MAPGSASRSPDGHGSAVVEPRAIAAGLLREGQVVRATVLELLGPDDAVLGVLGQVIRVRTESRLAEGSALTLQVSVEPGRIVLRQVPEGTASCGPIRELDRLEPGIARLARVLAGHDGPPEGSELAAAAASWHEEQRRRFESGQPLAFPLPDHGGLGGRLFVRAGEQGQTALVLLLESRRLGAVRVDATVGDGDLELAFTCALPESASSIRSACPALRRALEAAGIRVETVRVLSSEGGVVPVLDLFPPSALERGVVDYEA